MFAYDVDGDGKADVISSSAHQFGIWWYKHGRDPKTQQPTFDHARPLPGPRLRDPRAHFADINGDGLKDLVTGKRFWSHGRSEPGHGKAAQLYWFEATKNADKYTSFMPLRDRRRLGHRHPVRRRRLQRRRPARHRHVEQEGRSRHRAAAEVRRPPLRCKEESGQD